MDLNDSSTSNEDPDWNKIERDMTKVGIRDGLSDGRESNFQQSFDKGYEDGFHNAFILSYLKFQSEQKKKMEPLHLLGNAKNGMCVVCNDKKDNDDVAEVRKKQIEFINSHIERIKLHLDISSLPT